MSPLEVSNKHLTSGHAMKFPNQKARHDNRPHEHRSPFCETYEFKIGGADGIAFPIHVDILLDRAPGLALRALTCGSFELYDNPTIDTFRVFLVWLYTGELHPVPADLSQTAPEGPSDEVRLVPVLKTEEADGSKETDALEQAHVYWRDEELVDLYEFAQQNGIHALGNATLDVLIRQNHELKRTTSSAAVRRMLDSTVHMPMLSQYVREETELRVRNAGKVTLTNSDAFLKDYMNDFMRECFNDSSAAKQKAESITQSCRYHVHQGAEKIESCARRRQQAQVQPKHPKLQKNIHHAFDHVGVVLVGPARTQFAVHKGLICHYAEYFRGAFEGGFVEGRTGKILLEEEDPDVFSLMLTWLYEQRLERPSMKGADVMATPSDDLLAHEKAAKDALRDQIAILEAQHGHSLNFTYYKSLAESFASIPYGNVLTEVKASEQQTGSADKHDTISINAYKTAYQLTQAALNATFQTSLVDLYILADRRGCPSLQDVVMDEILKQQLEGWPLLTSSLPRISNAFDWLPSEAGLCSYMVDEASWCWNDKLNELPHLGQLPSDFLARVVQTMLDPDNAANREDPPWQYNKYHTHQQDDGSVSCGSKV